MAVWVSCSVLRLFLSLFFSLNLERFLTKRVVFIIYACDDRMVWSDFAYCVVLCYSPLNGIES